MLYLMMYRCYKSELNFRNTFWYKLFKSFTGLNVKNKTNIEACIPVEARNYAERRKAVENVVNL